MLFKKLLKGGCRAVARASTLGLATGPHATRYAAYRHLVRHRTARPTGQCALSISGSQRLCQLLGYTPGQITDAQFPQATMLALPFGDATFDAVASDQVLEHVEGNPFDALAEAFRVLRPGGLALHATCLMVPIHPSPGDFWRFTPAALHLMAARHGEVLDCGGWGNPAFIVYSALGMRYVPVPHARWHPIHWVATWNDPWWPVFTWVLARKAG